MRYFILFILFLLLLSCQNIFKESYMNYQDISFQGIEQNCPQIHANNYNRLVNRDKMIDFYGEKHLWSSYSDQQDLQEINSNIKSAYQIIQPFGYTKNELFDMTRFIKTDIPLPTDPDFFNHI